MKSSAEINKLCESWWARLSDSQKTDQGDYATRFLSCLGWTSPAPATKTPAPATLSYVLRAGSQTSVAVHFLMPGTLEAPSTLIEHGLDFCLPTRQLVTASRLWRVGYALITDLFRSYLYDVQGDELLLYADNPNEFTREFTDVLSKADVERGALEEVRRNPRSYVARQLREWCLRWCDRIAADSGQSKDTAFVVIDRLLILRYLFKHNILKRSGKRMKERFLTILEQACSPYPTACGKALRQLFHDFWLDWDAELFAPASALERTLEKDEIIAPMLRELGLLSESKFAIGIILESFNFGDATEKCRVRMVPEPHEGREVYLYKIHVDKVDEAVIELDLAEEGYRAIFYWFDRLVATYARLAADFEASESSQEQSDALADDLFAWGEKDARRPDALSEPLRHAIEHGLAIYYQSPRQQRTARLMLHLYFINRQHQSKKRFEAFPRVSQALKPRPASLPTDHRSIYSQSPDTSGDAWDNNSPCKR